ncbi:type III pantothenate kinase [Acetitomaculum ruminis DSM 5522]|uniref:Type III pantothenate kinase n=1 Tax=Acetitomaculum ruminis DSM 5522 TaxID=1120918 RepID=A0A1I0X0U3_9FIRM|nr:type III pantothenate kinase [Acetitomaculum ruminis]SFA94619.1 type III pantothenate kinase [Acetitomaculum ruminis DSM 5522]
MLLALDVGNTNITSAIFDGEKILGMFRITTKTPRTADEIGVLLKNILQGRNISPKDITDAVIASVVPNIMHALVTGIERYLCVKPMIIDSNTETGIKKITYNPGQIGTDRIVDAAGALSKYDGPLIVIDFGTATTYDLILEDHSFAAGITAPGIQISAMALWRDAAQLPEIEIKKPDHILAKETISSMQAGLVYGQIGQTEYIIKKMKEEAQIDNIKVVATGGLGRIIAQSTDYIDFYDKELTMIGLLAIFQMNKKEL